VEYSIILALLALAVVAVLVVFGPGIGNLYSQAASAFGTDGDEPVVEPAVEPVDVITIAQAEYEYGRNVHIDAQVNGGSDPGITLSASPGGVMQREPTHYHIYFEMLGCPCEVTITSSTGSSTTVIVRP
jgi:hypothetical protein